MNCRAETYRFLFGGHHKKFLRDSIHLLVFGKLIYRQNNFTWLIIMTKITVKHHRRKFHGNRKSTFCIAWETFIAGPYWCQRWQYKPKFMSGRQFDHQSQDTSASCEHSLTGCTSEVHDVWWWNGYIHRESKKRRHYTLVHIFAKY